MAEQEVAAGILPAGGENTPPAQGLIGGVAPNDKAPQGFPDSHVKGSKDKTPDAVRKGINAKTT